MRKIKGRKLSVFLHGRYHMTKSKKVKFLIGDVVAIPLPNGQFAYAKVFNDYGFGIYDFLSPKIESFEKVVQHPFSFFQAGTHEGIEKGLWPILGNDPFKSDEDAWTPPAATCYIKELNEWSMGGIPRINHKGQMRTATLEEVQGLDILSVCNRHEQFYRIIVDRLINGNHTDYQVQ